MASSAETDQPSGDIHRLPSLLPCFYLPLSYLQPMIAHLPFSPVPLWAALRTSLRLNLFGLHKSAKPRLFSLPFGRAIAMSYAGPPRGKPGLLLHAHLPSFADAGVKGARKVVQGEKIDGNVRWRREVELDLLAQEATELHEEL
eukprot:GFKZ01000660.1.p1 GENE.GFKZ01000660.1~~GFKZ01000660.1.p1  ORF type:complete len:144 (-),score=12.46 GFKZ01000660.1:112-543(-)